MWSKLVQIMSIEKVLVSLMYEYKVWVLLE